MDNLTDNERLTRARAQYFILRSAEEELESFPPGLRAHGDDGMPHGSTTGDALPREVIRRDELQSRVRAEQRRLKRYQKEARRIIGRMDKRMAMFAVRRYIYCQEIGQIKDALDGQVSASQIDRYKQRIEG